MSLAIFISEAANVFSAPEAKTTSSCADRLANLLGWERKGKPVSSEILRAARSANSGCAFKPVPTAVPPMARSYKPSRAIATLAPSRSSKLTQPENSCSRVSGVASCKCVRPIFTIPANSLPLASSASRSFFTAGSNRRAVSAAAAMCMAVGNVSLDDCDMFTSSLG